MRGAAKRAKKTVVRRKPGRPPVFGERHALGLRVTKETKAQLDAAAKASGRSLSQEAELRLEHTFKAGNAVFDALDLAYGRHWTGILLAISNLVQVTGSRAVFLSQWKVDSGEDWETDPYAYDQVVRGITLVLESFRPKGAIEAPSAPLNMPFPQEALQKLGEGFARTLLEGLADPKKAGPAWPFHRDADAIRERLAGLLTMPPARTS